MVPLRKGPNSKSTMTCFQKYTKFYKPAKNSNSKIFAMKTTRGKKLEMKVQIT